LAVFDDQRSASQPATSEGLDGRWYAVWTHSHCEQLVRDQLVARNFHVFMPTLRIWSRRTISRRPITVPMFPGYLFVHHAIDKSSYIAIVATRGVTRILGQRWDRLTPVADDEIEALQRIADTNLPIVSHPYLHEGQRVLIKRGPLAGLEGILVRHRHNRGLLVLSVELLHQSVAVEVDCTTVVPIGTSATTSHAGSGAGSSRIAIVSGDGCQRG
jgi:transcription antitermination factor NusG